MTTTEQPTLPDTADPKPAPAPEPAAEPASPIKMGKKIPRQMTLAQLQDQIAEKLGMKPVVELTMDDGFVVKIPALQVLGDEATTRVFDVWNDRDLDTWPADAPPQQVSDGKGGVREVPVAGKPKLDNPTIDGQPAPNPNVRLARALLGSEVWDKFKAAGGEAYMIVYIFNELNGLDEAKKDEDADPNSPAPSAS